MSLSSLRVGRRRSAILPTLVIVAILIFVIAATIGASLLFLATKTSLGDYLHAHAGPWLAKVERGFADNQWSYLLMMRLFPAIPFFIANLIPAFLGVPLPVFIVTTFVGIIPATAIFTIGPPRVAVPL